MFCCCFFIITVPYSTLRGLSQPKPRSPNRKDKRCPNGQILKRGLPIKSKDIAGEGKSGWESNWVYTEFNDSTLCCLCHTMTTMAVAIDRRYFVIIQLLRFCTQDGIMLYGYVRWSRASVNHVERLYVKIDHTCTSAVDDRCARVQRDQSATFSVDCIRQWSVSLPAFRETNRPTVAPARLVNLLADV